MRSAYVIADDAERMTSMKAAIHAIEAKTGATAVAAEDLLEEICYITEYPHGLLGAYDAAYLELPRAVLVNVMKGHQRYIPLERETAPSGPPSFSLPTPFRPIPPRW